MSLVQLLPDGPLDVVGDIHGEICALQSLLTRLGYDARGHHPQGRRLVFVGDLCDRGPDSPAVLACVLPMLSSGRAWAVLGNHEINLLRQDAKDGSGWFFDEREALDAAKYAPFVRLPKAGAASILAQLLQLPIALERPDLRIVHAAWSAPHIARARQIPLGQVCRAYDDFERAAQAHARETHLSERLAAERQRWPHSLEDEARPPPFLPAHSQMELDKARFNPLKVLTCGLERAAQPFYAGAKWRFVGRVPWWNEYGEGPGEGAAVVIGHYWRSPHLDAASRSARQAENQQLFGDIAPFAWHGLRGKVFCVDYSVGGRWAARKAGADPQQSFKLAALRWPERTLVFDDGSQARTEGFGQALDAPQEAAASLP